MKKFWIIATALFLMGTPVTIFAQSEDPDMEVEATGVTIQGNRVRVTNAEGKCLEIFNLTGLRVAFVKIDSNDKQIPLNLGRGCYIIKVGKIVRKITIR